jgi:transposase-like protein
MQKRTHDPETKSAVLAALAQKQPVDSISQLFKVPRRTIYFWRDQERAGKGAARASVPRQAPALANAQAPAGESEQALRAELRTANHKLAIMRQALLIMAEG